MGACEEWVWEHSGQTGTALLVLLVIARHAKDGPQAWPGLQTLSRITGLNERTVRYNLRRLEAAGVVRIEYRAAQNGCNLYSINTDYVPATPEPPAASQPDRPAPVEQAPAQAAMGEEQEEWTPDPQPTREREAQAAAMSPRRQVLSKRSDQSMPMPQDFQLSRASLESAQAQARKHGVHIDVELLSQKFLHYYKRDKGKGQASDDWSARWDSWVLDDIAKRKQMGNGANGNGRGSGAYDSGRHNGHAANVQALTQRREQVITLDYDL